MKENNIEEAIKVMEHWIEYEKNNKEKINRADELINIQETILSAYKRVLKENEELRAKWDKDTHILQNKLDYANADRIDLAQQNKELRKENEELKDFKKQVTDIESTNFIKYKNYIPIQKIKDKISERQFELQQEYKDFEDDAILIVLQQLLEERK